MMMLMIDTKMENAVMVITMITNHFKILHSQYKIYIVKVSSMALKMLTTLMLRAWVTMSESMDAVTSENCEIGCVICCIKLNC